MIPLLRSSRYVSKTSWDAPHISWKVLRISENVLMSFWDIPSTLGMFLELQRIFLGVPGKFAGLHEMIPGLLGMITEPTNMIP